MALFRYFAEIDGEIRRFDRADYRQINENGKRREVPFVWNGTAWQRARPIEFKANPSLHKCDTRCTHAKGHACECSCGGKNHGIGG